MHDDRRTLACIGDADSHACAGHRLAWGGEKCVKRLSRPHKCRVAHRAGIAGALNAARSAPDQVAQMWSGSIPASIEAVAGRAMLPEQSLAFRLLSVSGNRRERACGHENHPNQQRDAPLALAVDAGPETQPNSRAHAQIVFMKIVHQNSDILYGPIEQNA